MDNFKGNKCWTMVAGLAALVTLGVVAKVTLSFCLSSHGHSDVDATIAKTVERLCCADLPTFTAFMEACKAAISANYSRVREVCRCSL